MLEYSKLKLFLLCAFILSFGKVSIDYYRAVLERQYSVPTIEEIIPEPKQVNLEQLRCLATNIYYEAGGEPFMGQVAVARVVMNRIVHGFASTPCKVIYQSTVVKNPEDPEETRKLCQFSWVCQGKTTPDKINARYRQAEEIARQVLSENKWAEVIPNNVLFFHNLTVDPNWAYRQVITIGNHIFYSRGKEKPTKEEPK